MTPGQSSPYGSQSAPAGRPAGRGGSTISVQTLIVASVASAVTSYTVSRLWGPGTLLSAAATPILVALISELVRRPVVGVSSTAQKVAVAPLRFRPATQAHDPPAPSAAAPAPAAPAEQPRHPPRPVDPGSPATGEQWAPAGAPPVIEQRSGGPRWRLVLMTGVLACVIVVGLFTALDVIAGKSITGNGDSTTYFSGSPSHAKTTPTTPVPALVRRARHPRRRARPRRPRRRRSRSPPSGRRAARPGPPARPA